MSWAFADAWGLGLACLDGLALCWLRFAAIWHGRRFVWLGLALPSGCDLASLFALRSWLRLGLGFAAICFVLSWLRFGMAWLGLGFVVAQCLRFAQVLTGSGSPVW